ncbi:hypothetical protein ACFLUE_01210 [Chloroflexota bacterium]
MEVHSNWYNNIAKEINLYQDTLDKKVSKKYKLDLLLRIAGRVDGFSGACGDCQLAQQDITTLTKDLSYLLQMPNKNTRKSYFKTIDNIVKHLKKQHKLVTKGQYIGIYLAISVGIGAALGVALDNAGIGPAIGTAIGLTIGSYMDKKAEKEGRVI